MVDLNQYSNEIERMRRENEEDEAVLTRKKDEEYSDLLKKLGAVLGKGLSSFDDL